MVFSCSIGLLESNSMSKVDFCGKYTKTKSCFWSKSSGISLIVGKRAKPNNSSKTRDFLLFKESTETKRPSYLSSLYPTPKAMVYEIEYSKTWYEVEFESNSLTIKPKEDA